MTTRLGSRVPLPRTSSRQGPPFELGSSAALQVALALATSLVCGAALGQLSPGLVALGIAAIAATVIAFAAFGESAVLGLLFFAVPCIPIVTKSGGAGAQLRIVLLAVLTGAAAVMYLHGARTAPKRAAIPVRARRVSTALFVMAA